MLHYVGLVFSEEMLRLGVCCISERAREARVESSRDFDFKGSERSCEGCSLMSTLYRFLCNMVVHGDNVCMEQCHPVWFSVVE